MEKPPSIVKGQPCPMCQSKTMTLMEAERDIAFFGKVFLFSMTCSTCKYHKADVECAEKHDPAKYAVEVSGKDDLDIRIIKSSEGTVKIPFVVTIESGPGSNGYITNVEGLLNRVKRMVELQRDSEEDAALKKKAKNMLKKIQRTMWGSEKLKIIIEDHSGNSAIISDKAKKTKLKK